MSTRKQIQEQAAHAIRGFGLLADTQLTPVESGGMSRDVFFYEPGGGPDDDTFYGRLAIYSDSFVTTRMVDGETVRHDGLDEALAVVEVVFPAYVGAREARIIREAAVSPPEATAEYDPTQTLLEGRQRVLATRRILLTAREYDIATAAAAASLIQYRMLIREGMPEFKATLHALMQARLAVEEEYGRELGVD